MADIFSKTILDLPRLASTRNYCPVAHVVLYHD